MWGFVLVCLFAMSDNLRKPLLKWGIYVDCLRVSCLMWGLCAFFSGKSLCIYRYDGVSAVDVETVKDFDSI